MVIEILKLYSNLLRQSYFWILIQSRFWKINLNLDLSSSHMDVHARIY